jgi:serine/threonine protein kinase
VINAYAGRLPFTGLSAAWALGALILGERSARHFGVSGEGQAGGRENWYSVEGAVGGMYPEGSGVSWSPDHVIPAGSRLAGYGVEAEIGRGGMAVVFRAYDERLGRQVALKVMAPAFAADDAFRQRFARESRAAATVDDPHIIPVYEAGEAAGVLFIAMRYVGGGDVGTLLRRHGPLSPPHALAIVSPVASALDAAHRHGLIHRDVKPTNLLLDVGPGRSDHVYLSDFGLSKRMLSSAGLTGTGQFLGTLDYSAPEQIQGRQMDGRVDQYALACTVFELLSGAPPFSREEITAVILAHMSEPPPALTTRRDGLPSSVDEVLARALAKTAADRYPTCRDFVESLRAALLLGSYSVKTGTSQRTHPATVTAWPSTVTSAPPAVSGPSHSELLPSQAVNTISGGSAVLAFSSVGHLLTRSTQEPVVRRWNPASGDQLNTTPLQDGDSQVLCHQFSADGSLLASGGSDETIRIWNTDTGRHLRILKGRTGWVVAIALSPDNSLLASCTQDSPAIRLWDIASGNPVHTFKNDMGAARTLAFSLDGRILAIGGSDHMLRLWDITTGRCLHTLRSDKVRLRDKFRALSDRFNDELPDDDECDVSAIVFSPDRQTLAAGDEDGIVRLWTLTTGRLRRTLNGTEDEEDEDDRSYWGSRDYTKSRRKGRGPGRYRERKGSVSGTFARGTPTPPVPGLPTYESPAGYAQWPEAAVNPRSRGVEGFPANPSYVGWRVSAMAFSPGGRQMAIAIANTLQLWDLTTGDHVRTLQGHAGPILALRFSPDGGRLASSDGHTVHLWA